MKPIAIIFVLIILGNVLLDDGADDPRYFKQKGYFKDSDRNRIVSVELLKSQYSRSEVIKWAERTPNTTGRITQVYFYQRGGVIPSDGLTLDATSVWNAQEMLYEMRGLSKWRYAYVTMINGSTQFIECEADPSNDFCRTKQS